MHRIIFSLCLFLFTAPLIFTDESNEETLARILKDAVSIVVHSEIVIHGNEKYWESDITKVTVPGRTVTLLYETGSEKLSIELTPFKREDDTYMLTAMSNFWHEDEEGARFRSSFKSINLQTGELILFYPLGLKTQEALTGGNLYMEMGIRILPYVRNTEEQPE